MPDWRDQLIDLDPEIECVENGDPFVAEIVKADDIIDDHMYNAEALGVTDSQAARTVAWVERERLSFELSTLFAWWAK